MLVAEPAPCVRGARACPLTRSITRGLASKPKIQSTRLRRLSPVQQTTHQRLQLVRVERLGQDEHSIVRLITNGPQIASRRADENDGHGRQELLENAQDLRRRPTGKPQIRHYEIRLFR